MIIRFEGKASREELCKWAEVARSSFHYRMHPGSRGMKASAHTPIGNGMVTNEQVVDQMRAILVMDYCTYGYQVMTRELQSLEYVINKKKVYRLMKEHHLLCGRKIKTQGKRIFVSIKLCLPRLCKALHNLGRKIICLLDQLKLPADLLFCSLLGTCKMHGVNSYT